MVANAFYTSKGEEEQQVVATRIAKIATSDDDGKSGYIQDIIKSDQFSLMANLVISEGIPATSVIRVHVKQRIGPLNFPESIRTSVRDAFGVGQPVSIGGVFVMTHGKAKLHVMPDFPIDPWKKESEIVDDWLRYFEMSAPLVCTTVLHSSDTATLGLRLEHTHCFSEHGDAGHYHYDTTPESVEYEAFIAPVNRIYRIDRV